MNTLGTHVLEYWRTSGFLALPLAVICFGIWAYYFDSRRSLRSALRLGPDFERLLGPALTSEPPARVADRLRNAPGPVAQATITALWHAGRGGNPGQAFDERAGELLQSLDRNVALLAALTAAAPLIGLLGTVIGMVATFDAVSTFTGDTGEQVAAGIGQALVTTQCGLVVAIPGVFGVARLHRFQGQLRIRFASCRSHLLLALSGASTGVPPHAEDPA